MVETSENKRKADEAWLNESELCVVLTPVMARTRREQAEKELTRKVPAGRIQSSG